MSVSDTGEDQLNIYNIGVYQSLVGQYIHISFVAYDHNKMLYFSGTKDLIMVRQTNTINEPSFL